VQFVPRKSVDIQLFHERIRIKLFDVKHAGLFPVTGYEHHGTDHGGDSRSITHALCTGLLIGILVFAIVIDIICFFFTILHTPDPTPNGGFTGIPFTEFAGIGTGNSKGTKVFSLVGKITNTGLVEVPMGITLRRIIEEIGGGVKDGKAFKAVQTGGPSGGCIPAKFLDAAVDFDELTRLGSMMGSGGMIVMDEDTCMVNIAKYFLGFLKSESCGKCTPCREGIAQMLSILERISKGEGELEDLNRLENLAELLTEGSLCALGKTAANPILSTLRYFREEYEEHIKNQRCPAKECKGLFLYQIDPETCTGCGICRKNCPVEAITGERKQPHVIDQQICTKCNTCFEKCPFGAINKV